MLQRGSSPAGSSAPSQAGGGGNGHPSPSELYIYYAVTFLSLGKQRHWDLRASGTGEFFLPCPGSLQFQIGVWLSGGPEVNVPSCGASWAAS